MQLNSISDTFQRQHDIYNVMDHLGWPGGLHNIQYIYKLITKLFLQFIFYKYTLSGIAKHNTGDLSLGTIQIHIQNSRDLIDL